MQTIKSKMAFVVVVIAVALSVLIGMLSTGTYRNYRKLKIEECEADIHRANDNINDTVSYLQANVRGLALAGGLLRETGAQRREYGGEIVTRNLRINTSAAGGGIWFEPYAANPAKELVCYYAFRDGNDVVFDENFQSEAYHYPTQQWYAAVKEGAAKDMDVIWTPPYRDKSGTRALMTTVGCGIYDEKGKFVGMSTVDWKLDAIAEQISSLRPTKNSFTLFADEKHDYILALNDRNAKKNYVGEPLASLPWLKEKPIDKGETTYDGVRYITYVNPISNGMLLIVFVPQRELFRDIDAWLRRMVAIFVFAALLIAATTYLLLDRFINRPVGALSRMAGEIGAGNLDARADLASNDELGDLAQTMARMTNSIREYVARVNAAAAEKERIATELDIAAQIQEAMLPSVFPPFPARAELDVYALMQPAREVGGDFYDFFFIDETRVAVVIGDVSDKGVPAALFMVVVKTLIEDYAAAEADAGAIFARVNARICKGNSLGMFVTAFLGILDTKTGALSCANAGHMPPIIRRAGGSFERLTIPPGFVLGGMEETRYATTEASLAAGDILYLYTDGVTEAENAAGKFFGDARLAEALASCEADSATVLPDLLSAVKRAVDAFADGAPQFDDITMLGLVYRGAAKELVVRAEIENLPEALRFVESELDAAAFPADRKRQLILAAEEIYANIAHYAYADRPEKGGVRVRVETRSASPEATVRFIDDGVPFNPLASLDPDIAQTSEERRIGGLGIYLAKKNADDIAYERRDGQNILTIRKFFH